LKLLYKIKIYTTGTPPFIDRSGRCGEKCGMMIWIAIAASLALTPAMAQDNSVPQPVVSAEPVGTIDTRDAPVEPPVVCFSAREMNDRVARLRLYNPLIAMQTNARRNRAEPLRTRLCRTGIRLIYEQSLIRKDGKVLLIYLNAQNGRPMASPRK
jgi:hypothetical protein